MVLLEGGREGDEDFLELGEGEVGDGGDEAPGEWGVEDGGVLALQPA